MAAVARSKRWAGNSRSRASASARSRRRRCASYAIPAAAAGSRIIWTDLDSSPTWPPARHPSGGGRVRCRRHATHGGAARLCADVLVPELRPGGDEVAHELHARRVIENLQLDAARAHVVFRPLKRLMLADDDLGNLVQQRCAAAHVAGRERRVEGRPLVVARSEPAGVFQAIHLGMQNRATLLHAPVKRRPRSEEHTSELQSLTNLVCRLLLEKKKRRCMNRSLPR